MIETGEPNPLSRSRVEALARQPDEITAAAIAAAVARVDYEDAIARAAARALAGLPVAIDDVVDVLPGTTDPDTLLALVAVAHGDRAEALVRLVERDRFPVDPQGGELAILAAWAAWRLAGDDVLPRVTRHVRRLRRHDMDSVGLIVSHVLLDAAGAAPQVEGGPVVTPPPGLIERLERRLAAPIGEWVARLPDEAELPRTVSGFTVRSAPRPGRNEPCPCGSGKKYKRCCMEKDEAAPPPSPIAGLSWADYLRDGAPRMTTDDVLDLPLRDLARVDLARLGDGPLVVAMRRWTEQRRWDQVERACDAIAARTSLGGDRDAVIGEAVTYALGAREPEIARRLAARIADEEAMPRGTRIELALVGRPPDALDRIEAAAMDALRDPRGLEAIELAYGLLGGLPPLGILVARGCLKGAHPVDAENLLDEIEEIRAELDLPEGDPAWEIWEAVGGRARRRGDGGRDAAAVEARALRSSLEAVSARAAGLEQQLASLRKELAATLAPAPASSARPDPDADRERRTLRERIETLEAQIREGNAERQALRKRLAKSGSAPRGAGPAKEPPRPDAGDDDDALVAPADHDDAPARRGVLVPQLARAVEDRIAEVPAHVAAEAMRTLGELAAGDAAAWRGVKQAKDMRRPLFSARIGIHHRMLFRVDDGRLEVVELVTREGLMHALKRLRNE